MYGRRCAVKLDFDYPGCSNCRVHRGFYDAFQSVVEQVQSEILSLAEQFPDYSIFVTGHSLGGALAVFGALDVKRYLPNVPVSITTFGKPRVGNPAFANFFSNLIVESTRMVNKEDIVPHLPPLSVPDSLSFWQSMREVWIQDDGALKICEAKGEHNGCSPYGFSVDDHLNYLGVPLGAAGCQSASAK